MRIQEAAERFLVHMEVERGCTPATISAYGADVKRFLGYLAGAGVEADSDAVLPAVVRPGFDSGRLISGC